MNVIHRWSNPQTIENIKPLVSSSIPCDSFVSQYHNISSKKKETIFIQSTLSTIICKNKRWLKIKISTEEKKHSLFFKSLEQLTNKIQTITQKKYTKKIIWDNHTNHKSGNSIILYGKILDGCIFYDTSGNKISFDLDNKRCVIDFIFTFSQLQIISPLDEVDTLYGKIILEIVQIRIHNNDVKPIEKYSFDNNAKETPKKEYAKYFDMLKKGVPRRAVEQRMISEGIDIGVLDGKNIPLNNKNNPIPINKFSVQDLKNIKLKKTSQNKKIAKTKPRRGIQLGISLDSIQNALKGLKKTNIISSFSDL
tara:strand:+ start:1630 stop:2553 length:924 start_codon:yes stop_codon:yes gene_type:complete